MTISLHVKRGIEFKADLYNTRNRTPWLEAVGKELEAKGVSIKLGDGAGAVDVKNAADLVAFYTEYAKNPDAMAAKVGLPKGRELSEYMSDLVNALDDVVKDTSRVGSGDKIDLTKQSELAKVLGLSVSSTGYASTKTEFGAPARPQGAMSVLGVRLSKDPIAKSPLEGKKFIDAATFAGQRIQTGRDSVEIEAVRKLGGLDKDQIIELATAERGGRPVLNRMRRAVDAEAFSLGYSGIGFDQMRWDSDAHRVREMNPYVSLTVEGGRLEKAPESGQYEVTQGTDVFQDTYYRAVDPGAPGKDLLLDNDMMVRSRVRLDRPGQPSRLLIQAKLATVVDETGMKSAAKVDIRDDSPTAQEIAGMDDAVRTGKSAWGWGATAGNAAPISAIHAVYQDLNDSGKLPDVGEHKGVLMLEPGAHIVSQRSRYHLNETNSSHIKGLFDAGKGFIEETKSIIDASAMPAAEKAKLSEMAAKLLDKSTIAEKAKDAIIAADPTIAPADITPAFIEKFWPREMGWNASGIKKEDIDVRKAVADAIKTSYNEFSEAFDGARTQISGSRTDIARRFDVEKEFVEFVKEKNPAMVTTTTFGPFLKHFDEQMKGPGKDAFVAEFATFLSAKGSNRLANAANKDEAMGGLRNRLVNEHLDILHRQVEASGTAGQAMWFDEARKAYASANRQTWNFLIDTYDYVQCVSPKDWEKLTPEQKDGRAPIPPEYIYSADIVAEVQIELGYEKDYMTAIKKAKDGLADARAGLFMDFALQKSGTNVVADKAETFAAYRDGLVGLDAAPKKAALDELNAFAESKGSPLRFTDADLPAMTQALFTPARQNQPTTGHDQLVKDLEVTEFIWSNLTAAQDSICALRGNRTLREAERAGLTGLTWSPTDMSKGATALTRVPQD
jgi:hypothetical protein